MGERRRIVGMKIPEGVSWEDRSRWLEGDIELRLLSVAVTGNGKG